MAALLTELKERHPEGSVCTLMRQAQASGHLPAGTRLVAATVYRLLKHADLADRSAEAAAAKDRRRFASRQAGELGMSDVLHGPAAGCDPTGRCRRRQTSLLALPDDATRVVPHAAFAFAATAATFLPVLQQAVLRRGLPCRLSGDHGTNYRSRQLAVVCASLGVPLIHARPYQPAGKGKIERFFGTVRAPFLAHLEEADTRSLATLNAKLRGGGGRDWKASTTKVRTAAWLGARRWTKGPWRRRTCAAPTRSWTSTGSSASAPNAG